MKRLLFALLLVALPAGAQVSNLFNAGETLDFDLTWLSITGGGMRTHTGVAQHASRLGRQNFRRVQVAGGVEGRCGRVEQERAGRHERLNGDAVEEISSNLRRLLADVFALYMKTKNFHWHMSGRHFRDYHLLLDEHAVREPVATGFLGYAYARIGQKDKAMETLNELNQLASRLGRNHELAAALWDTGWYEARMLTSFVDEPELVTPAQMDRWCKDFDNWAVPDTVCFVLFDRTPHAFKKIEQWAKLARIVEVAQDVWG